MERQDNIATTTSKEYYTIDLVHVFKTLWRRVWLIILAGLLAAGIGFSVASFGIEPTYSSSVMLYVNNNAFSLGNTSFSISASEITAAQSLVKTYSEILKNRTTLERVIEKSGVDYSPMHLNGMISASPANDTEIMKVTVVSKNADEAALIANCIAEVLPVRISEIIDGASMEVVDYAVANHSKIAPSITRYTAIYMIIGVLLSTLVLAVFAIMDDTIHDEEYVIRSCEYPILAKVPDLINSGGKQYGYYYSYRRKNKQPKKEGEQ